EEVEMGERLGAVEPHVGPSGVAGGMPGAGGSAEPARGEEAGEEVEEAVLAARHMDDLGGARAVAGERRLDLRAQDGREEKDRAGDVAGGGRRQCREDDPRAE